MFIEIKNKEYKFSFGFAAMQIICESNGYDSISGFDKLVKKYKLDKMKDPTFVQMRFFADLIIAGIKSNDKAVKVSQEMVLDGFLNGRLDYNSVMNEINKSLPQNNEVDPEKRGN